MDGLRRMILLTLLALGSGIILAGLAFWIWQERPVFDSANPGPGTVALPALYAAALFLGFYTLRTVTARAITWAAARQHQRTLRLLQRVAPRLARSVLGTALGASLTLSSTAVAAAWAAPDPVPHALAASQSAAASGAGTSMPSEPGTPVDRLPSPRWSAEPVNVPMARIAGGQKQFSEPPRDARQEVVVAEGQTLWSIAAHMLGRQATIAEISALWPRIYELNRTVIGADPDLLQVGAVLVLPPLQ